jgi:hypothetical protein
MIFGEMFKDMSIEELFSRYEKAKQATEGKWEELMHHRINVRMRLILEYPRAARSPYQDDPEPTVRSPRGKNHQKLPLYLLGKELSLDL